MVLVYKSELIWFILKNGGIQASVTVYARFWLYLNSGS